MISESLDSPTPAMVRAMAATLRDHDVNPIDEIATAMTLIRAGFPAKLIEHCFDAVVTMALIRYTNEERKR